MASAEQLKALLRSHIEGDEGRFLSIAMQVAAHEAKLGHGKLAEELRDMIDAVKAKATLGEICAALKEVYGTYREPVVL